MTFRNLKFQGEWREYQARVLSELKDHLDDGHLHVVAAPGSGKTILGLEVMRELGGSAIIFAPSIAIRNQWIDRLVSMFMPEGEPHPDWISKNIREPRFLTVTTYQALHAALSGEEEIKEEELLEAEEEEEIKAKKKKSNKSDIIALLNKRKVQTIVLDEAHHLRKEWWSALTKLKAGLDKPTTVSLTATPPYDAGYSEWLKYEELCGPIDAEIPVPELVKRGDLCPHQDYVYFSLPTALESQKLEQFKSDVSKILSELKENDLFLQALSSHPWIKDTQNNVDDILAEPKFFSSLIVFFNSMGFETPKYALKILGVRKSNIPEMSPEWLEVLLTGVFYSHTEHFVEHEGALAPIRKELKRAGAIDRRKVIIDNTSDIKKLLASSLGKLDSVVDIARTESGHLGDGLRMVVLADFIRKSELPSKHGEHKPINKIGVVPIFEYLRRANIANVKLGILTGSLIFIPKESKPLLESIAAEMQIDSTHIRYGDVMHDSNFLRVDIKGENRQRIVHLITELFNAGGITVLVGTQALLGEGWDAPSINTLVLASYVGSYMLSNQMRGRAIRKDPNAPHKASNIWHLVSVDIETLQEKLRSVFTGKTERQYDFDVFDHIKQDLGNDVLMMCRRFRAFEGLSYDNPPIIENGIRRLNLPGKKWDSAVVKSLNESTLARAASREELIFLWDSALQGSSPNPAMRDKVESNFVPQGIAVIDFLKYALYTMGALLINWLPIGGSLALMICAGILLYTGPQLIKALWSFIRNGTLTGSMKQVSWAVLDTLHNMDIIKTNMKNIRLRTEKAAMGSIVFCRIDGVTAYERQHFLEAMQEVLGPTDNPRYVLVRKSYLGSLLRVDYHPVPKIIAQKKENAQFFAKRWNRYIGKSSLIYTRTSEGRMTLLQARTQSSAAAQQKKTDRVSVWE
jgi:superfamily II DNA or RNA helicase